MTSKPNGFAYFIFGEWAPNKIIFWIWEWIVLLAVLVPWSWLSSLIWNKESMWVTYSNLAAFGTFAIVIGAIFFEKQLLPKHLQKMRH